MIPAISLAIFALCLYGRCLAKGIYRFFAWLRSLAAAPQHAPFDPLIRAQVRIRMLTAELDDLALERDVAWARGYDARRDEEGRGGRMAVAWDAEAQWN